MRRFVSGASGVFGFCSLLQVTRLARGWTVVVAGVSIPNWPSFIAAVVMGTLAVVGAIIVYRSRTPAVAVAPTPNPVLALSEDQVFQAALARLEDHTETLRTLTAVDLQIFGGFLTLQLALGAWLATNPLATNQARIGVGVLDATLACLAAKLLYNGYRRRTEIVASLANARDALSFNKLGVYLDTQPLDAPTVFRPFWGWYLVGITVGTLAIAFLLYGAPIVVPKP